MASFARRRPIWTIITTATRTNGGHGRGRAEPCPPSSRLRCLLYLAHAPIQFQRAYPAVEPGGLYYLNCPRPRNASQNETSTDLSPDRAVPPGSAHPFAPAEPRHYEFAYRQAGPNSRNASPAPARLVSFISAYLRDSTTPGAPALNAAITAAFTSAGCVRFSSKPVGISTSIPG
jgi:hypothetical protein